MREQLLKTLYNIFPFNLKGDVVVGESCDNIRISCVINFYGRLDLLNGILYSLAAQNFSKNRFEVVLIEDQGGTAAGAELAEHFQRFLDVRYYPLDSNFGKMGYSRNYGMRHSRGEVVLFLDDDTVITDRTFLDQLDKFFCENTSADAVVPHGSASYSMIEGRYDFHEPYFMTSRCMAYRRAVLCELGGFVDNFVGQEDVEYVIRFLMAGKSVIKAPTLHYYHPPLLVPNLRKPKAVGNSFYGLKSRYPFFVWLLVILNCCRHAPLFLVPIRRCREMGRFGIGFLLGVLFSLFKKEGFHYS